MDFLINIAEHFTGLFPHANSSELFVWLGVSGGFASVGNQSDLAIRFLLTGFVICLIRGIVTEQLAKRFAARRTAEVS
jgi:PTS system glucitol/sorbitol-specific IIC component